MVKGGIRGPVALSATLTLLVAPGWASAKPKPLGDRAPAFYTGTLTGSALYAVDSAKQVTRWRATGLKLKRERVIKGKVQKQRRYRVTAGTVAWSHHVSGPPVTCNDPDRTPVTGLNFEETFSLKGIKASEDTRMVFFAASKGKFKNRWRVDGEISPFREMKDGVSTCPGDPPGSAAVRLPSMFSGIRLTEKPPVARAGKPVTLRSDYRVSAKDRQGRTISTVETRILTLRPSKTP